ncbi:MAG: type IV pilus biogenesis protein CpaD/CtpE, partial [Nonlabens sp.]
MIQLLTFKIPRMYSKVIFILISCVLLSSCKDNDDTTAIPEVIPQSNITVYNQDQLTDDYVLISPFRGNSSFLMDRLGTVLHRWSSAESTLMGYLREDGSVVRSIVTGIDNGITIGGKTGAIEIIDKDNNQIWKWNLD